MLCVLMMIDQRVSALQAAVEESLLGDISAAERIKEEEIAEAEKKCNLAITQAREQVQGQLNNEDQLLAIANVGFLMVAYVQC